MRFSFQVFLLCSCLDSYFEHKHCTDSPLCFVALKYRPITKAFAHRETSLYKSNIIIMIINNNRLSAAYPADSIKRLCICNAHGPHNQNQNLLPFRFNNISRTWPSREIIATASTTSSHRQSPSTNTQPCPSSPTIPQASLLVLPTTCSQCIPPSSHPSPPHPVCKTHNRPQAGDTIHNH